MKLMNSLRSPLSVAAMIFVALLSGALHSQSDPFGPGGADPFGAPVHRATIEAAFSPSTAEPGDQVTLQLQVTMEAGWHIYGQLTQEAALHPVLSQLRGLQEDGALVLPAGKVHHKIYSWLEGKFTIERHYRVPFNAEPGEVKFRGSLAYQPCTPELCDPNIKTGFDAVLAIGGSNPRRPADEHEKATIPSAATPGATVAAGSETTLTVVVEIQPEWHVYGALQGGDFAEAKLRFNLDTSQALKASGEAVIPDGVKHTDPDLPEYVYYWVEGQFPITQKVRIPADTAPGEYTLSGSISYQPCDAAMCLGMETVAFATRVTVVAGDGASEPEDESDDDGLLRFILLAIGGGLFALVMPCTYPMIPITISFFTKQAAERNGSVLPLSICYGLGIITVFILIGVAVGEPIIRVATHPATNIAIGVIFFVFALSLFGVFNLNPPRFLMNLAGKASGQGGYGGVFLMGATLVITSFTCTGPVVGALLSSVGTSEGASLGRVALGMGVFGLTMAVPFVILSLLPGRMQAMPRSGEWMNTVKVFLGFVEVAAALKFISNADMVMEWQVLSRELFLFLWAGVFMVAAAYLFGMILVKTESASIGPQRLTVGLATFLFAIYCLYGALGNRLDTIMIAITPNYSVQVNGGGSHEAAQSGHTIVVDDYDKARAMAIQQNKKLLLNLTGKT